MIFLLLTIALASGDPLKDALQSSDKLLQLFSQFEVEHGRHYPPTEAKLRLRLFRKSVRDVVDTNEQELGWQAGINFFSDLTEEEGRQYLGLNMSVPHSEGRELPLSSVPAAESLDWRQLGGVTPVKNKGSCGSLLTFG